jgi:hypothetical protein
MRNLYIIVKTILTSLYLLPFIIFMVFDAYSNSKKMDIPFQNYLLDTSWVYKYFDEYISFGYKMSMGVWIAIYTIYILIK